MKATARDCWQINLQVGFGGGEVYTGFLVRALEELGVHCHVFVSHRASYWSSLLPATTEIIPIRELGEISEHLPFKPNWLISHGQLPPKLSKQLAAGNLLTGVAHMPPQQRLQDRYDHYHRVFGVSAYVLQGLIELGIPVWETPLYGVADLRQRGGSAHVRQSSCYDWDKRKGRDLLFSWLEPFVEPFLQRPYFTQMPGKITIGIVSRLTPIKQFPLLFSAIAPKLAEHPAINLEVFGAGGYASVRDLREALRPLGKRARFWGQQQNVASIYQQIDYLLLGLPEKEALGLNVLEAQACGTPVLAVEAPPFKETIVQEVTGLFYVDPRNDKGQDFDRLLTRLEIHPFKLDNVLAAPHLAKFEAPAFKARISELLDGLRQSGLLQ